jgi:hypothetical protein
MLPAHVPDKSSVSCQYKGLYGGPATGLLCERYGYCFYARSQIANSGYHLRHVRPSVWNNSAPTGRIFMKFELFFFGKSVEKMQV